MASMTMADLMDSLDKRPLNLSRGQQINGTVSIITDSDLIIDLGTKSEGVISKRELDSRALEELKVGSFLQVYVVTPENESGQVVLSLQRHISTKGNFKSWDKFVSAMNQKRMIAVKGLEVNKGGLLVEAEGGVKGFLPSSQANFGAVAALDSLVGKELDVRVLEVDPQALRLIVSQKGKVPEDVLKKLTAFKSGQKVSGKVVAVLPFGVFVDLDGMEGLVHVSDVAWTRTEDLGQLYQAGEVLEAQVLGVDETLGRVNLSIKSLSDDPFVQYAKDHLADDVVSGTVIKLIDTGAVVSLGGGVEGLLPANSFESGAKYEPGQKLQLLIAGIDENRHRITLAPFLTSTEGLIYK